MHPASAIAKKIFTGVVDVDCRALLRGIPFYQLEGNREETTKKIEWEKLYRCDHILIS